MEFILKDQNIDIFFYENIFQAVCLWSLWRVRRCGQAKATWTSSTSSGRTWETSSPDTCRYSRSGIFILSSPSPSPKSQIQVQIQVPNPKSKVQRRGTGTWVDTILLQTTTTTYTFSHLKCHQVMRKDLPWPSLAFLDFPWHPMTFLGLLWHSITFYALISPSKTSLWPSMNKCLLSSPGQISEPPNLKPKLNLTEFRGLTLSTPSLVYVYKQGDIFLQIFKEYCVRMRNW